MYDGALFGHVLGATLLISAVVIAVSGLLRAHRARTTEQVRTVMSGVPVADGLIPPAMVLVLGFGLYLVAERNGHHGSVRWSAAWVIASLVLFGVMSLLGPTVEAHRAKVLYVAACAAPDGPISPEIDRLRRDPLHAHVTLFGACQLVVLLYLMTNRPDLTATVTAAVTATVVSAVLTRLTLAAIPAPPDAAHSGSASTPALAEGALQ